MLGRAVGTIVVAAAVACGPRIASETVVVFAASSLQTALDQLIPVVERDLGVLMAPAYGASSTMARQIEQGAPAALFISADTDWMDYLESRSLLEPGTRRPLLTNNLVLIVPAGRMPTITLDSAASWQALLGDGRLAVAETTGVPAGRYARQALTSLGVWHTLADRLAPGENVRAALQLVARLEAPLGIVYRTDALAEPNVMMVATFPADSHAPIVYPIAGLRPMGAAARRVLEFLQSETALDAFRARGFGAGAPQ